NTSSGTAGSDGIMIDPEELLPAGVCKDSTREARPKHDHPEDAGAGAARSGPRVRGSSAPVDSPPAIRAPEPAVERSDEGAQSGSCLAAADHRASGCFSWG